MSSHVRGRHKVGDVGYVFGVSSIPDPAQPSDDLEVPAYGTPPEPGSTDFAPTARHLAGTLGALSLLDGPPARLHRSALPSHPPGDARNGENRWIQAEGAGGARQSRSWHGWDEVCTDTLVLSFDGRVLELFGDLRFNDTQHETLRFHVGNLRLVVGHPDRNGRREVRINLATPSSSPDVRMGTTSFLGHSIVRFDADEWVTIGPFLTRVKAACEHHRGGAALPGWSVDE